MKIIKYGVFVFILLVLVIVINNRNNNVTNYSKASPSTSGTSKTIYGHEFPYFGWYVSKIDNNIRRYTVSCYDDSENGDEKINCTIDFIDFTNEKPNCEVFSTSSNKTFLFDGRLNKWIVQEDEIGICGIIKFLTFEQVSTNPTHWAFDTKRVIMNNVKHFNKDCEHTFIKQERAIESDQLIQLNCNNLKL